MEVKIKSLTFQNKQHRIAGLHCGPLLIAGEKVSMSLTGPFVACDFANDPACTHLVPLSGISDVCIEKQAEEEPKTEKEKASKSK